MKTLYQSLLLALGALALAGTSFAQVPSSNDTSDGDNNTGMGTGALAGVATMDNGAAQNTASGYGALFSNTSGCCNDAFGVDALQRNNGSDNTGLGYGALENNTTANDNTATGAFALYTNTTGSSNTADGYQALAGVPGPSASTGSNNTGIGAYALFSYSTGSANTASGYSALYANTTGVSNTAVGYEALYSNTTGSSNTATGINALLSNTTANGNTATGVGALKLNTTGSNNVAEGYQAGHSLTTGSNNIVEGYQSGYFLATGNYNIDIGNKGVAADGVTANSGVIRIGTTGQQATTFIAGIENAKVTGSAVYVTSAGQLGVLASSERYKTAIAPMGSNSEKLQKLRPVTFHLKTDPTGAVQYGLIAEEVAEVYPELVIRDATGKIQGVRYDELAPMLLNQAHQDEQKIAAQAAEIRDLKLQQGRETATQNAKINQLLGQLTEIHAALVELQSKDKLLAVR